MGKGTWFQIPGVQDGERTVGEQLLGLERALAGARGKCVWDLGCAEGMIAIEFVRAGAVVEACDYNEGLLKRAHAERMKLAEEERERLTISQADLRHALGEGLTVSFDIVLALAVVHKLQYPEKALGYIARAARELVVIRLPGGSTGRFRTKGYDTDCDVNAVMPRQGFVLECVEPGPRDELVQYWRRA